MTSSMTHVLFKSCQQQSVGTQVYTTKLNDIFIVFY